MDFWWRIRKCKWIPISSLQRFMGVSFQFQTLGKSCSSFRYGNCIIYYNVISRNFLTQKKIPRNSSDIKKWSQNGPFEKTFGYIWWFSRQFVRMQIFQWHPRFQFGRTKLEKSYDFRSGTRSKIRMLYDLSSRWTNIGKKPTYTFTEFFIYLFLKCPYYFNFTIFFVKILRTSPY